MKIQNKGFAKALMVFIAFFMTFIITIMIFLILLNNGFGIGW